MAFLGTAWVSGLYITSLSRRGITRLINLHHSTMRPTWPGKSPTEHDTHNQFSRRKSTAKPPNVLVYTGSRDVDGGKFNYIRDNLLLTLSRDAYVIYKLEDSQVEGHPWSDNAALLVIDCDEELKMSVFKAVFLYLVNGGKVLSLSMSMELCSMIQGLALKPLQDNHQTRTVTVSTNGLENVGKPIELQCAPFYFEVSEEGRIQSLAFDSQHPVLVQAQEGQGTAIMNLLQILPGQQSLPINNSLFLAVLRKLDMKCDFHKMPELTPAFLFADTKHMSLLMDALQPHLKDGICKGTEISLLFCNASEDTGIPPVTYDILPVIAVDRQDYKDCRFDWDMYRAHLTSKTLGQVVLYTDVIQSTHTIFDGNHTFVHFIPEEAGVAMVARQQVKGKGRGGNAWLSPIGCLMFSLQVKIHFNTKLGSRLPYLQHIASLALVEAVRELPGYEDIDVRLKWPNDIYYGRTVKIGGVLVTSSVIGNTLNAVLGMGVNVSNSEPTICINDIIRQHNTEHGTSLATLPLEMVLARTVTWMELLINEFQEKGKEPFLERYYNRWLHLGSKVTLNIGSPESVTIIGLDEFGFLSVQKMSGEVCSVQPDGNTFDMLHNLIQIKI